MGKHRETETEGGKSAGVRRRGKKGRGMEGQRAGESGRERRTGIRGR